MANEEHLAILRKGVKEWNRWREENPEVRPDLREAGLNGARLVDAYLARADLGGSHLADADLEGADFAGADLAGADLVGAYLFIASLSDANLSGANLFGSELVNANLSGAKLFGAELVDARLASANLFGADLARAKLAYTVFAHVDLRQVKGLESIHHQGPSTLGTNTLERSRGQIPEVFLKGCGLSDWEIEAAKLYDPDLTADERTLIHYEIMRIQGEQPIMQTRLFISYSHGDSEFVEALEPLLDGKGVRYWRDVHDMRAGRIETQIDRGIALYPLVLLVLSENSVRSDWVEDEATRAREVERQYRDQGQPRDVLCPVTLDDAWKKSDWPRWLRRQIEDYAILDFSGWRDPDVLEEQFGKLYEGIVLNYKV